MCIEALSQREPVKYHAYPALRGLAVTAAIVGIAVAILASNGQLATFPQTAMNWFSNLNMHHVVMGLTGAAILSCGAGIVINRAVHKEGVGALSGSDHWVSAYYSVQGRRGGAPGYIDTSRLDATQSGEALYYGYKPMLAHYYVSLVVAALTPLHIVASVAYNVLRAAIIPFYIMGCMAIEKFRGGALFANQRAFEWNDIPKQIDASIRRAVKAPFYGVAQMFAGVFSFIDPLNGRKLGAEIELAWNEGVTRSEGWWSIAGPQSLWRFEGGGGPETLGRNGFYAAGCWTPMARVTYVNGAITGATGMSGRRAYQMATA